jgi:hypothetical protein
MRDGRADGDQRRHRPASEPATEPPGKPGPISSRGGVGALAAQRIDARDDEDEHRREQRGPRDAAVEHEQAQDRESCEEREADPCAAAFRCHIANIHPTRSLRIGPLAAVAVLSAAGS